MAIAMAYCRFDIRASRNKPLHCSHGRMHIDGIDAHFETNARTLSRPNTDAPGRLGGYTLSINFMLTMPFTLRTTGRLVVFS